MRVFYSKITILTSEDIDDVIYRLLHFYNKKVKLKKKVIVLVALTTLDSRYERTLRFN